MNFKIVGIDLLEKRKMLVAHRQRRQYNTNTCTSRHLSLLGQLHSDQNWSTASKHFTRFPESLHEFSSIPPWQTPN